MEFGFGLITCQRYPGDLRSDFDLYQEALALAGEAERLGFDSIWVSEQHFIDDAYMPSLLPVCAAMGALTQRIKVGTAVLLAPLYEPVRLAEDVATVDLLSNGRFVLGLGQGWRTEEFNALRVPLKGRNLRLEETVATLRQAWSGGPVTGGRIISYPGVAVRPMPVQRGGPPIWIGATSESAIRRAGRLADGYIARRATPESFAVQVSWVREELELAGRNPALFAFGLHFPTFAWHGDDAWERVREYHYYVHWKYEDVERARGRTGPPASPPRLTHDRESELRRGIVVGPPQDVAERLLRYQAAAGGKLHYIARLYWPGMDPGLQREAMTIFAEEVIPKLR